MESFEVIPQLCDSRVAIIIGRLKAAAHDKQVVSVITKSEIKDPENSEQNAVSTSTATMNVASCPACPDALLEFCNEIKPCYSSTMHDAKAHGASRFSQRDMERSVQGQQIANNRQHRYDRKMRKFVNPLTRVEISQHKILENPDENENLKFADRESLVPVSFGSLKESTLGEMYPGNDTEAHSLLLGTEVCGWVNPRPAAAQAAEWMKMLREGRRWCRHGKTTLGNMAVSV